MDESCRSPSLLEEAFEACGEGDDAGGGEDNCGACVLEAVVGDVDGVGDVEGVDGVVVGSVDGVGADDEVDGDDVGAIEEVDGVAFGAADAVDDVDGVDDVAVAVAVAVDAMDVGGATRALFMYAHLQTIHFSSLLLFLISIAQPSLEQGKLQSLPLK